MTSSAELCVLGYDAGPRHDALYVLGFLAWQSDAYSVVIEPVRLHKLLSDYPALEGSLDWVTDAIHDVALQRRFTIDPVEMFGPEFSLTGSHVVNVLGAGSRLSAWARTSRRGRALGSVVTCAASGDLEVATVRWRELLAVSEPVDVQSRDRAVGHRFSAILRDPSMQLRSRACPGCSSSGGDQ
jgi:hypothetical protein